MGAVDILTPVRATEFHCQAGTKDYAIQCFELDCGKETNKNLLKPRVGRKGKVFYVLVFYKTQLTLVFSFLSS